MDKMTSYRQILSNRTFGTHCIIHLPHKKFAQKKISLKKARSRQGQGDVKGGSRQAQSKVKERSKKAQAKVKVWSRQGQGQVKTTTQAQPRPQLQFDGF